MCIYELFSIKIMKLIVKQGENIFRPQLPAIPWFSSRLKFRMKLDSTWWDCDVLTEPKPYGCKLMTLGKLNYHEGGANWGIGKEGNQVFLWPRYYEPIKSGLYKLHELSQFKVELQPDTWYELILDTDTLMWRLDGRLLAAVNLTVPHCWLAWPFMGRSGNDNRYTIEPIPGAFASQQFNIQIIL